jgi:hypothetical protein
MFHFFTSRTTVDQLHCRTGGIKNQPECYNNSKQHRNKVHSTFNRAPIGASYKFARPIRLGERNRRRVTPEAGRGAGLIAITFAVRLITFAVLGLRALSGRLLFGKKIILEAALGEGVTGR